MKKMNCFVFVLIAAFCFCSSPVLAANEGADILITVDGKTVSNYKPLWNDNNDKVMIEASFFKEFFNADVDTANNVTTISKNGRTISYTLGDKYFLMDGIGSRVLDTPNFVVDHTPYLPLRYMSEALGATSNWDNDSRTIAISTGAITLAEEAKPYFKDVAVYDQSTIRITGEKTIYIDPYRIKGEPHDADIILVTHTHSDHFDIESIKNVMKDSTVLYVTENGVTTAVENGIANVKGVLPYNEYTEGEISFRTVPSYNTSQTRQNHKQEYNWVGYIITVNSISYYASGDTDYIPDMDDIEVDVAFLPIDGRYNMDEVEAARAANAISPKIAVPYHFNNFSTVDQALNFISLLNDDITGAILTFQMYTNPQ